jgi:Arylsulfotransferase (ASST)
MICSPSRKPEEVFLSSNVSTHHPGDVHADNVGKRIYLAALFVSVVFLAFVAGSLTMISEVFPSRYLADAYKGGLAFYHKMTQYNAPYQYDLWRAARTAEQGVTIYDPAKAYNGLTLYTSGHAQKAFLVDMEGRVVHEWGVPFSQIWDPSAQVKRPQPDTHIYIEKAVLYPNGDLLAVYVAVGDTPWGYGLVKMDKDSNILWKYLAHAHHDVDVASDGNIYVLTQAIGKDDLPEYGHLKAPRIDDYVAVLSSQGEEIKKIRLIDAMLRSPYKRLFDIVPWYVSKGAGDYLHTNSIEVLDGTRTQRLPEASDGRVLLSFREISTLAILDIEKEEIVWAVRGPWLRQHDPDLLPNGNMLVFDNQGNIGPGGITRVIEFDPSTLQIVWTYSGTPEQPFDSEARSSQERLPNGNTLITEAEGGRLFEVTPQGEIVWNYINPVRVIHGGTEEIIPITAWAHRIDPASLEPDFNPVHSAN